MVGGLITLGREMHGTFSDKSSKGDNARRPARDNAQVSEGGGGGGLLV